ncbi:MULTISPECIES: hypothetical protein [Halobacterium]|uniref:DUF7511 domain-containing protein n=4 Tax=Halobacterium salinarum TaxID=2242 RepID=Q9HQ75_HALSA|nr:MULTISPECIES: hypothetical protein [Halobacterium]AAG19642.1 hypothetical protein VNG_1295H [Halobacterium salinarum NRC-1]MBB6090332.1 hypothetical protein [Halobacterium salinarum]MCF2165150.1 hypothetical protein [Halobacterium salinarum]MCF2168041.1 hypothetical protein [Halobacterium salinarum]MCF2206157.1 hypothetical protein [Halobacterium salinarum]
MAANSPTCESRPTAGSPLQLTVVRYSDDADRATVTPVSVVDGDVTTTWLSVDAGAVVSLADAR